MICLCWVFLLKNENNLTLIAQATTVNMALFRIKVARGDNRASAQNKNVNGHHLIISPLVISLLILFSL